MWPNPIERSGIDSIIIEAQSDRYWNWWAVIDDDDKMTGSIDIDIDNDNSMTSIIENDNGVLMIKQYWWNQQ